MPEDNTKPNKTEKVITYAYHGKLHKLLKLLEAEDDTLLDCPSVDHKDGAGCTALHAACQQGHADCVELLLKAGAVVDAAATGGVTPLIIASEKGHANCIKHLLDAKADVLLADADNKATALHGACQGGHAECADLLIKSGASVDAVDSAGASPLIIAVYNGHPTCVEQLLSANADAHIEYEDGKTALEIAADSPHEAAPQIAALLAPAVAAAAAAPSAENAESRGGDGGAKAAAPPRKTGAAHSMLAEMGRALEKSGMHGAELLKQKEAELDQIEELSKQLRQRRWADAVTACDQACAAHAHYTKALFRRAQAKRALKEYAGSMEDVAAANEALCRAGGGAPVGEAGKKMDGEMRKFAGALRTEYEAAEAARIRCEREEFGITLAEVDEDSADGRTTAGRTTAGRTSAAGGKAAASVYYHYATGGGEKTQDFMWWMRQQLRAAIPHVRFDRPEGIVAEDGFRASTGEVHVTEYDPDPYGRNSATRGLLDGTCAIRTHKGRRALFFELTMEVPWVGTLDRGLPSEASLGGKVRLWNITHFSELMEWKHLSSRNVDAGSAGGPSDAIAQCLAPAIAAALKVAVQGVIGQLLARKLDPSMLEPPKKPPKPTAASRAWGKGTTDYSKWDAIDSDEGEEPDYTAEDLRQRIMQPPSQRDRERRVVEVGDGGEERRERRGEWWEGGEGTAFVG